MQLRLEEAAVHAMAGLPQSAASRLRMAAQQRVDAVSLLGRSDRGGARASLAIARSGLQPDIHLRSPDFG
nr:hypothetical protein [Gammaproteobacteria bacterium]